MGFELKKKQEKVWRETQRIFVDGRDIGGCGYSEEEGVGRFHVYIDPCEDFVACGMAHGHADTFEEAMDKALENGKENANAFISALSEVSVKWQEDRKKW